MFHKEGYKIILITTILIGIGFIFIDSFITDEFFNRGISIGILLLYLFILQQFRAPKRSIETNDEAILSVVDGTLKSIEEIDLDHSGEKGYLLSFYVSPLNIHMMRSPFDGLVVESKSEQIGDSNLYIKTIHIKSNTEHNLNALIQTYPAKFSQNTTIYPQKNSKIVQGEEIGFIKFDSKVTVIIPKSLKLQIKINDRVKAGEHSIATI